MKIFVSYIILINFIAFSLYGIDKYAAKNGYRRISEKTLILISFFGGIIGSIMGMKVFHHKTRKIKFILFNFLVIIIYIIIFTIWRYYGFRIF